MEECVFCKIVRGEIQADTVMETDEVIAFRDINPQAPTHIQIIPRKHISSISEIEGNEDVLMRMVNVANRIAEEEGIKERGYRLVINCGPEAGQSVMHLHMHLLGGRPMRWPPG
ncbi:MAG: histidine triad nucleotide-binding protein [Candidatus Coatesbacteria bacterium]|nr:MAG: histidine triad nucleotide-binding protein [Candidatus Coatesbacteria bacterium]RLC41863.1 MAG: histidine triad nucleotide-binding protein [Candidatus Coatesbacteria bacterium]RLC44764.1 MAG: histidine triad nucleotide-binding protein [Candidatus Coatesbacteria bacterium]HEC79846.1 histidine triad nucleotide-binding protein [Bacillota bacterium]